jgi:hypothetical protein
MSSRLAWAMLLDPVSKIIIMIIKWVSTDQCQAPVVPATQEAEAGGLL